MHILVFENSYQFVVSYKTNANPKVNILTFENIKNDDKVKVQFILEKSDLLWPICSDMTMFVSRFAFNFYGFYLIFFCKDQMIFVVSLFPSFP